MSTGAPLEPPHAPFVPPFCPRRGCPNHVDPQGRWFRRKGYFVAACRAQPVPRFHCHGCNRSFSRQTFRYDYRHKKPWLDNTLFRWLAGRGGLREFARRYPITRNNLTKKFRKMADHLENLHRNIARPLPAGSTFQLDELITFEGDRRACPVAVAVLIERDSRAILATTTAPLRPTSRSPRTLRQVAKHEAVRGRRRDRSRAAVAKALRFLDRHSRELGRVVLESDHRSIYGALGRRIFGARFVHERHSSTRKRDPSNPLFPINHTLAIARDVNARLTRRSWLASKDRRWLERQMSIFKAFRNCIRRRRAQDKDDEPPAVLLGWLPRALSWGECLGWRQDFGARSIAPWFTRDPRRRIVA